MTDKLTHEMTGNDIRIFLEKSGATINPKDMPEIVKYASEIVSIITDLKKENEQLKQEKADQVEAAYKEGKREDLDYDDYSEKDIDECWQSSQAYRKVKDENR